MLLAPYMSYFISFPNQGVFQALLVEVVGQESLPDLQSPLNLYANCSVLFRSWKETKASQFFFPNVNTLETFKVWPILNRMVKVPYPGLTDSSVVTHTGGLELKDFKIQRRSLSHFH